MADGYELNLGSVKELQALILLELAHTTGKISREEYEKRLRMVTNTSLKKEEVER
jgi:hypothetical protein